MAVESEVIEAIAAYDFDGRGGRELSFKKGQTLLLYSQVSPDWWDGAYDGKEGLIPDKYIELKRFVSASVSYIQPLLCKFAWIAIGLWHGHTL